MVYGNTRSDISDEDDFYPLYYDFGFTLEYDDIYSFKRELRSKWRWCGKKCSKCHHEFIISPPPHKCPICGAVKSSFSNRYEEIPQYQFILVKKAIVEWLVRITNFSKWFQEKQDERKKRKKK
jgi:hypothetical protein